MTQFSIHWILSLNRLSQKWGQVQPKLRVLKPRHLTLNLLPPGGYAMSELMAIDLQQERQQVHSLVDLLPADKLGAVRSLLEVMIDDEEEELTEEDRAALQASNEYFLKGGEGIPFEQVVADLGFTMEQIRGGTSGKE
jgi:hypothetical protein